MEPRTEPGNPGTAGPGTSVAVGFRGITKRFPGVLALEDVSFDIAAGSMHALCGENGAGKSTLGKVLAGIHQPDGGEVLLFGTPLKSRRPEDALAAGVGMVHQELAFCENLSVAENLCLRALPRTGPFLSKPAMYRQAEELLAVIDASIDVRRLVGELTIGQQQMLQIASAVGHGAKVIVFDEPTSSLSQHEAEKLYELIGRLQSRGVTGIYVTHRMEEIFRLCDTITVLRDGRHVATAPASGLDTGKIVEMMIGRRLAEYFPPEQHTGSGRERLRVSGLSSPAGFRDVSFSIASGEVVGMAGLVGAGRSEVARAIFGLDGRATGQVLVDGQAVHIASPREAMRLGIGLVPEDRKRQGLVLSMTSLANMTLAILPSLARATFVQSAAERALGQTYFDRLRVRAPGMDAPAAGLSGGNQQKLVLAKWLAAQCQLLILDEPTRGVDVGAKAEIHALIAQLAAQGVAVLLISSELPELLHLASRILVLREGHLVGELPRADATQDALMRLMAGVAA
ncbi:MAG: sugar ABC transporter ATP-binding protein [Acidobacteriota bacterium]